MTFVVFTLGVVVVFLGGALMMAAMLAIRYGDTSACYKLYAVRDRLIHVAVFENVHRDDPWHHALYQNVNAILKGSGMITGPDRWPAAIASGVLAGRNTHAKKRGMFVELPMGEQLPPELDPVLQMLHDALEHLAKDHIGWVLRQSARKRAEEQAKREAARQLKSMLKSAQLGCPAAAI